MVLCEYLTIEFETHFPVSILVNKHCSIILVQWPMLLAAQSEMLFPLFVE